MSQSSLWSTNSGTEKLPHDLHSSDKVCVKYRGDYRVDPHRISEVNIAEELYWIDDGEDCDIVEYCLESEYEAARAECAA